MALQQYHAKRDFKRTPEPRGRVGATKVKTRAYLIQKHAASHLHYDFRLELNGMLLSWAVPKGPSLDPADKRLAMHVEDHPVEYGGFEGIIPKGQYGGGTVMLWDRGTWNPVGDPEEGLKRGHLKFDLNGEKLQGRWALIKTHGNKFGGKGEPWLLIKDTDSGARRGVDARIVDEKPDSVLSERTMDEIAAAGDHEWHSNKSVKANVKSGAVDHKKPPRGKVRRHGEGIPALANVAGAKRTTMPVSLSPELATLVKAPPQGEEWVHEVKYDGYRMLSRLENGTVQMFSRNNKDWTDRLGSIADEVGALKAKSAWLDGEVCAIDAEGRSNFQELQNALSDGSSAEQIYFAFDLIYLDGYDLRNVALIERKRLLKTLLERSDTRITYSPEVRGSGAEVFKQSCPMGLEGIISKRADAVYGVGIRSRNWVKVKCLRRQEMVIGGFSDPQGSRTGFGALLLGVYESGKLRYAGKVGTGFNDKTLVDIRRKLERLEQKSPPFANSPRGFEAKGAHWVEPKLVAEVQFTEWSEAGALRHPSFLGLREDKKASEVVREKPVAIVASRPERGAPAKQSRPKASMASLDEASADVVAGVRLSHPDKEFFPEAKLTKLSLARYYEAIADWILPLVEKRPLSLFRCPDGWNNQCFYQKHADKSVNQAVSRVQVPEGGGKATYFAANSLSALVGLVQWGVIELHPWGSHMPHPERPDCLIFDFDPADDVSWKDLVKGVNELRKLLQQLGLEAFLKTTGGKGLHIVVPIQPTLTWAQAITFTKAIADLFARTFPDRFLATVSKAKRKGKIFIDYLRNAEGSTAIAAYGIRARKNAPVSTPITWKELEEDLRFDHFNVKNVPARLKRLRADPWKNFLSTRQTVTAAMFKRVGAKAQ